MFEHCPQPVVKRRVNSATGEEDEDLGADILCSYYKASVFTLNKNSAAVWRGFHTSERLVFK